MNSFVALILVSLIACTCVVHGFIQNDAVSNGQQHREIPNEHLLETCQAELKQCQGVIQSETTDFFRLLAILRNKTQLLQKAENQLSEIRDGFSESFDTNIGLQILNLCEGKSHSLQCPTGTRIEIVDANYGRKNKENCLHPQMYNTNCTEPKTLRFVAERCNSHKICYLVADNSVFGDPCVNTYKYLEVKHKCTPTPMTTTSAPTTTPEPSSYENE